MDAQRALLDQLMGAARNLTDEEKKEFKESKWDDDDVCVFYLVRFCPHDLFYNTRSDLGPCARVHDQKLKESFENSPRHGSYLPRYEAKLAQFCEKLVGELDRKVKRGRERLDQEVELPPPPPITSERAEQLSVLEEKIKNLLEQAESLGEAGKVDEAEALMRKVDILNLPKTALTQPPQTAVSLLSQEQKMSMCEICGSFLLANDALERTQSHLTGKQHIGYGVIRDFLSEYKVTKEKAKEEERLAREKEAVERLEQREKENKSRSRRGSSNDDRDRYRDRDGESGRGNEWNDKYGDEERGADMRRHNDHHNGRSGEKGRYYDRDSRKKRDRSRSQSPVRHGRRR